VGLDGFAEMPQRSLSHARVAKKKETPPPRLVKQKVEREKLFS
jgi:hypothetical protein